MSIVLGEEAAVPDEAPVWRRIPNWPDWTVFDENLGRVRPSSLAFEDNRDGSPMSAFLAGHGNSVADVLLGHEGFYLAAVAAGLLRANGLKIVHDPLEGLPSHVEVPGPKPKRVKSTLAKAASWVVPPPDDGPHKA
jgi:hypothetical protein